MQHGVNIFDPDAFAKIAAMEGPRWVEEQTRSLQAAATGAPINPNTFVGAIISLAEYADAKPVIYGDGGFQRYSFGEDGEIWFLIPFASQEQIDRARRHGFNAA